MITLKELNEIYFLKLSGQLFLDMKTHDHWGCAQTSKRSEAVEGREMSDKQELWFHLCFSYYFVTYSELQ
jgi:hypothetical protein